MTVGLGDKVKCMITGFVGIVISRTIHINGCDRFCVQPACGKDGKIPDAWHVDGASIKIIKKGAVAMPPKDDNGGYSTKAIRN